MHELSIAQDILDALNHEQQKHGFERVTRIRLRIGPLSNIVPESLRFCFDASSQGTVAEDAELVFEETSLIAHCPECGTEFHVEEWAFLCPSCGSMKTGVRQGEDMDIISVEVR